MHSVYRRRKSNMVKKYTAVYQIPKTNTTITIDSDELNLITDMIEEIAYQTGFEVKPNSFHINTQS